MVGEYRQTPPEDGDEWARFWAMLHTWEKEGHVVREIATVMSAALLIRRTLPYAVGAGLVAAALWNSDLIAGLIQ